MISNRTNIIVSAICAILAGIFVFIGLVVPKLPGVSVSVNPKEFEATVVHVVKKEGEYLITVEEYNCKLLVASASMVDQAQPLSIAIGEKIFFKLVEFGEDYLESPQVEQIFVVSLRTQTQELVTVESYYHKEGQSWENIKKACITAAILLGIVSVASFIMSFRRLKEV